MGIVTPEYNILLSALKQRVATSRSYYPSLLGRSFGQWCVDQMGKQMHKNRYLRSLIVIPILLPLCGCSTQSTIDFKNLHTYSSEFDEAFHVTHDLDPPYAALFKTQQRELLYVASRHDVGLETPTFHFIKDAFNAFSPDIIILEGFEEDEGLSPERLTQHIQNVCLPKWNCCGEPYYTTHLAMQKNINVIGAEPSNSETFDPMASNGYTLKDVVFFYFTRMIPQYYRQNEIASTADLIKLFPKFISNYMDAKSYTFNDYKNWLNSKLGQNPSWKYLIDTNYTAPIETGQYLQKISNEINSIRDQHILKVVFKMLEQHKKVMIVFGASHYPLQKDVLEQHLGRAQYFQKREELTSYIANIKKK